MLLQILTAQKLTLTDTSLFELNTEYLLQYTNFSLAYVGKYIVLYAILVILA